MNAWTSILDEGSADKSLILVASFLLTAVLVGAVAKTEKKRLFGLLILTVLHLILVPIAGVLKARGIAAYNDVRLPTLIFDAMAFVGIGGTVLFGVALPLVGLRVPRILRDVIGAVASIIAIFALARRAGFNLSGLIATSAVLTAVIGFSLQDTLGNIMGGLAIQLDNSIKVGDWIKVNDPTSPINGKVVEIRWRYTCIETRNWETIIVPNSILMKGQVLVLGRRTGQPQYWRRWIWFNVDFRHQPSDVIQAINEALQAAPIERVAGEPKPHAILMGLEDSWGKYAVRYWLTDLAVDDPTDSVVRNRIYFALRRAGIALSIPAHAVFMTEDSSQRKAEKGRADLERRLKSLHQVDLFTQLSADDLQSLAESLRYAPFTGGETITKQGAEAHWLYMIADGTAAVRVMAEGLDREVARLGTGNFFGEMGLMTGEPRRATVVAITDVECYRLDKAAFQRILKARPDLAEHIAGILAKRSVELEAVRDGLDEEAKARRLDAAKTDLSARIKSFFGIEDEPA